LDSVQVHVITWSEKIRCEYNINTVEPHLKPYLT